MVIQKTKKKILFNHSQNCIIITYTYLSNSKSNHALINPLNTSTLYSLPTLSFLVSKDEEEENEQIPDKIFLYTGAS